MLPIIETSDADMSESEEGLAVIAEGDEASKLKLIFYPFIRSFENEISL